MKTKALSVVLSLSIIGTAVAVSACSDEEVQETTSAETPAVTEETETETSVTEETELIIEPVEFTSLTWWNSDNDESDSGIDGLADTPVYTNATYIYADYEFDHEPDYYMLSCTVKRDGQTVYEGWFSPFSIYTDSRVLFPTNERGYIIPGDYVIDVYCNDELIASPELTVNYDEDTAPELGIITHMFDYGEVRHFESADLQGWLEAEDFYQAGCSGIYVEFYKSEIILPSTYEVEWFRDGESMGTLTYEYDGNNSMSNTFSLENPDGSGLEAGTYEINYYCNSELIANELITVR